MNTSLQQLRLRVEEAAISVIEDAFEDDALSVSSFEDSEDGRIWVVEALLPQTVDVPHIVKRLQSAATASGWDIPEPEIVPVADRNWVAATAEAFPPLAVGRFYIAGDHIDAHPPAGCIPLRINAATAFGTGKHETTAGCLDAIGQLARTPGFRRVLARAGAVPILDMGCGTAILAMAAAKISASRALAVDNDPEAVRVARGVVRANGAASRVRVALADSPARSVVSHSGPYGLILANILARPLKAMAPDLCRLLVPGGYIVLAGLLARQTAYVSAAYRVQGLKPYRRQVRGQWAILTFRR